jgi:hypothetical protein
LLSGGDAGPTYSPGLVTDLSPASSEVKPKETGPEDLQRHNILTPCNINLETGKCGNLAKTIKQ